MGCKTTPGKSIHVARVGYSTLHPDSIQHPLEVWPAMARYGVSNTGCILPSCAASRRVHWKSLLFDMNCCADKILTNSTSCYRHISSVATLRGRNGCHFQNLQSRIRPGQLVMSNRLDPRRKSMKKTFPIRHSRHKVPDSRYSSRLLAQQNEITRVYAF